MLSLRRKRRALVNQRETLENELNNIDEEVVLGRSHKKRLARKRRSLNDQIKHIDVEIAAVSEAIKCGDESAYTRRMLVYHRLQRRNYELHILRERLLKPEYESLKKELRAALKSAERSIEELLAEVDTRRLDDLEHEMDHLLIEQIPLDNILHALEIRTERDSRRRERETAGDVYAYGAVVEGSFEFGKKR